MSATISRSDPRRWQSLALLCLANLMVILDAQIVILGLPSIEADLGLSANSGQWIMSAYLLSFGGLLLLGGRAADLLGRRRMFMAGSGLFLVSSLGCGLAPTGATLIGSRVLQGVSAAIMAPTALSILMTTFPEGAERNKALGVWSAVGGVGATGALLIGGPLTDGPGWEWIFFINVPVALGLIALSPRLLRESRERVHERVYDVAGAGLITAALVMLVLAIVEAPDAGWGSPQTLGLVAASALLIGLFASVERRSSSPLVPLRVLRSRTLVGGNLTLLTLGMASWGVALTVSLYAQQVLKYSPVIFGLGTVVMTAGAAAASIALRPESQRRTLSEHAGSTPSSSVSSPPRSVPEDCSTASRTASSHCSHQRVSHPERSRRWRSRSTTSRPRSRSWATAASSSRSSMCRA